ncbi:MAG: hypothetical protein LBF84_00415, partial [Holosporales bacterium]|nr:hypothetical protein [Holosporales bacterium]
NSFIYYNKRNGVEYGLVATPRRDEKGKKVNDPVYLGKVLNKQNGIFVNKTRGVFKYTIKDGFQDAPTEFQKANTPPEQEQLILDFVASFTFFEVFNKTPYAQIDLLRKHRCVSRG